MSADGDRLVVSMDQQACHGSNLVFVPGSPFCALKGDFGGSRRSRVQQVGTRYIGYASRPPRAARSRRPTSRIRPAGSLLPTPSIQGKHPQRAERGAFPEDPASSWRTASSSTIAATGLHQGDRRPEPGSSGRRSPSRSGLTHRRRHSAHRRGGAPAASRSAPSRPRSTRPREAPGSTSSRNSVGGRDASAGFALMKLEGGTTTVVNTFVPPRPTRVRAPTREARSRCRATPSTGDINILMWARSRAGCRSSSSSTRRARSAGPSARSPLASAPSTATVFGGGKMSVYKRSGTETDVFLADGYKAWAMTLNCTPAEFPGGREPQGRAGPVPGRRDVVPARRRGDRSSSATRSRSRLPSARRHAILPISGWRFDLDFHPGR